MLNYFLVKSWKYINSEEETNNVKFNSLISSCVRSA